jgi:CubicO group peptidase (beta-lactamase class C family)
MTSPVRVRSALVALAAACIGALSATAQSGPAPVRQQIQAQPNEVELTKRIDEYVTAYVNVNDFSGSVLLARDGKPLFLKSYGYANREWQIPNAPDTRFRIGSITKQFTSMLIMQLREQGKLKLEDPVCLYVNRCPDAWKPVTIHHLLTHTSGIPSHTRSPAWQARNMVPHTTDQVVDYVRDLPLQSAPGQRFAYNNFGYYLLGMVVEKVTGRKYEDALQSQILGPLGLTGTGYDWPGTIIPKRASGYDGRGAALRNTPAIDMQSTLGSGAMYSTVLDLLKWDQALYGDQLLPEAPKKIMWTPALDNYACGWEIAAPSPKTDGQARMSHSGGINGFGANLIRVPQLRLTAIVLSNNESTPATVMSNEILAIYGGHTVTLPVARPVATVDPAVYDRYAGKYQLPSGALLTIAREGSKLYAEVTGPGKFELIPESETRFFSDTPEATIAFTVANGAVTQLVLNVNGRDRIARRVQ